MLIRKYLTFYRKYECKDNLGKTKVFEPLVKYTITDEDLGFFTAQNCKISQAREGDLFTVDVVHTNTYRD